MKKLLGGLSVFDFTMLFGRFVDSLLNIGFRTQASFPVEDGVTEFLLAQRLSGLLSLAFVNAALSSAVEHLEDMPAVRRADRFTDFADAQLVELLFHFRRNVAGVEPAEVTAAGARRVCRMQTSKCLEVAVAFIQARLDFI